MASTFDHPPPPSGTPPPPIDADEDENDDDGELPSYSPRPGLPITTPSSANTFLEHEYHLMNSKRVPWATLKVRCAPVSSTPYAVDGG
jgi:hypothetical protein